MAISASSGPLVVFGEGLPSSYDYNPDRGSSLFDRGVAYADPRGPFQYYPGQKADSPTYGWLGTDAIQVINQVPSQLSATNIALAQVPVVGTALTLTAGTGVTGSTSITSASTGQTVSSLFALDGAQAPVVCGQGGAGTGGSIRLWNPKTALSRNVRITSAGNDSTATFLVSGYDVYGYPMSERITGANAGVASGAKAFKYIASIVPAGTVSGSNVSVGTGDVIGLPLRADFFGDVSIVYNNAVVTASTGFTAAVLTDPATTTTGDVRGTYALQTASDGSRRLQVVLRPDPTNIQSTTGMFGVTQA